VGGGYVLVGQGIHRENTVEVGGPGGVGGGEKKII